jgi:integrase/recombinase XerD
LKRSPRNNEAQTYTSIPLEALMHQHLNALRVKNYSEYTVRNRLVHIGFFIAWLSGVRNSLVTGARFAHVESHQRGTRVYRDSG